MRIFFGIFRDAKKDGEWLCLKLPIINMQRVIVGDDRYTYICGH